MSKRKNNLNMWDRIMMAITFAEAGDADTARDMLSRKSQKQRPASRNEKENAKRPDLRL